MSRSVEYVSAYDVAEYILSYLYKKNKVKINNSKLQRILYFIFRDYYKQFGFYLFDDEIIAWRYGFVVPIVYYYYYSEPNLDVIEKITFNENNNLKNLSSLKIKFIQERIEYYGKFELEELNKQIKEDEIYNDTILYGVGTELYKRDLNYFFKKR